MVLDFETSGFSATENEILQVALIEFRNCKTTYFNSYVLPQKRISEKATKVHGLTFDFLHDLPLRNDLRFTDEPLKNLTVCEPFVLSDFLRRKMPSRETIVGHNVEFDMRFLYALWRTYNLHHKLSPSLAVYDTMQGRKITLEKLATELKIRRIGAAHNALSDALLTHQIFLKLNKI